MSDLRVSETKKRSYVDAFIESELKVDRSSIAALRLSLARAENKK
jgi:hypothetical protein